MHSRTGVKVREQAEMAGADSSRPPTLYYHAVRSPGFSAAGSRGITPREPMLPAMMVGLHRLHGVSVGPGRRLTVGATAVSHPSGVRTSPAPPSWRGDLRRLVRTRSAGRSPGRTARTRGTSRVVRGCRLWTSIAVCIGQGPRPAGRMGSTPRPGGPTHGP